MSKLAPSLLALVLAACNGGTETTTEATDATGMTSVVTLASGGGVYSVDQSEVASDPWSGTMTVACTPGGMTTTVTEASGSLTVAWVRR